MDKVRGGVKHFQRKQLERWWCWGRRSVGEGGSGVISGLVVLARVGAVLERVEAV
jgi:hypothetical protein